MTTGTDHARENAKAWLGNIREMMTRLEHSQTCEGSHPEEDYSLLDDGTLDTVIQCNLCGKGERFNLEPPEEDAEEWDRVSEALEMMVMEHECEYCDADAAREAIEESPLSVEVRSGWVPLGQEMTADEFCILLTTGGPSLRICGDLNEHSEPTRAYMQYQDWGTSWTDYYESGIGDVCLAYAEQFWYGD